jgi:predicted TIM-barrel fold metal-dependent hydrolase
MRVIDFHMHPFLTLNENICQYPTGPKSVDDVIADMKRAGISGFCGSVVNKEFHSSGFQSVRELNDHALRLRELFGKAYIPGAHVHPSYVNDSCEELVRMKALGVVLVGELVPYMMGWSDYSDRSFFCILEQAQAFAMAVNFHSMDFMAMEKMVMAFPQIAFIAAHPREYDDYMQHLALMKKYENYHLDISGSGLFRYGMLRHGINQCGKSRFLFGTDYPICNPLMNLQGVLYEKLTSGELDAVLYENAERILRLLDNK